MRDDSGYTFHFGAKFLRHMPYLEDTCTKLGTTRAKLIAVVWRRIFEDRMLEELGKHAEMGTERIHAGRLTPVRKPDHYADKEKVVAPTPRQPAPPVELHPLQGRKTTSEPLPESRSPSFATMRPHHFPMRQVEKTKSQLREELRVAVLNTQPHEREIT